MGTRDLTLLEVLVACFEKNEVLDGYHWRDLPMPDEATAASKYGDLVEEARRWKGKPEASQAQAGRRLARWSDLEIRQAGRGILVRAKAPWLSWWHEPATWAGEPTAAVHTWIDEERTKR